MKNITINLAATWSTTIKQWEDGDVFREAGGFDLVYPTIADRLGWLKTAVDAKPDTSDDLEFTGEVEFTGDSLRLAPAGNFVLDPGDGQTNISGEVTISGTVNCDSVSASGVVVAQRGYSEVTHLLADANESVSSNDYQVFRVPAITGNRDYTLADPTETGVEVRFTKATTAGFTATIKRNNGTTLAILAAGAQAAVTLRSIGSKWLVEHWTANVSSINADVS